MPATTELLAEMHSEILGGGNPMTNPPPWNRHERAFLRLDPDGVPSLVQHIRWSRSLRLWICFLFDGETVYVTREDVEDNVPGPISFGLVASFAARVRATQTITATDTVDPPSKVPAPLRTSGRRLFRSRGAL